MIVPSGKNLRAVQDDLNCLEPLCGDLSERASGLQA